MTPHFSRVLIVTDKYGSVGARQGMSGRIVAEGDEHTIEVELTDEMRQRVGIITVDRRDVVLLPQDAEDLHWDRQQQASSIKSVVRTFVQLEGIEFVKFTNFLRRFSVFDDRFFTLLETWPESLDSLHTRYALFEGAEAGSKEARKYALRHKDSPDPFVASAAVAALEKMTR